MGLGWAGRVATGVEGWLSWGFSFTQLLVICSSLRGAKGVRGIPPRPMLVKELLPIALGEQLGLI
jgi:hypothetical protein